uniref:Ovule protein n=1 Tax=Ascaris lumbricoides TaxID=6252 RepID=A0A0M3HFX9_ASCLU
LEFVQIYTAHELIYSVRSLFHYLLGKTIFQRGNTLQILLFISLRFLRISISI